MPTNGATIRKWFKKDDETGASYPSNMMTGQVISDRESTSAHPSLAKVVKKTLLSWAWACFGRRVVKHLIAPEFVVN